MPRISADLFDHFLCRQADLPHGALVLGAAGRSGWRGAASAQSGSGGDGADAAQPVPLYPGGGRGTLAQERHPPQRVFLLSGGRLVRGL